MSYSFIDEVWGPKKDTGSAVRTGPHPPSHPRHIPASQHPPSAIPVAPQAVIAGGRGAQGQSVHPPRADTRYAGTRRADTEPSHELATVPPEKLHPRSRPPIEWIPAQTTNVYAGRKAMSQYGHHFFSHETWMFIFASLFIGIIFFLYRIASTIGDVYQVMKLKNEFGFQ